MSITPTVGRVVLYRPGESEELDDDVRHAATVAHVHADGRVNLGVTDSNGQSYHVQNIMLVDVEDEPCCGECEWMEYQKGQAAKVDAVLDLESTKDISDQDDIDHEIAAEHGQPVINVDLAKEGSEETVEAIIDTDADTETGIELNIVDRPIDSPDGTDESSDATADSEESGDDTTAEGGTKAAES